MTYYTDEDCIFVASKEKERIYNSRCFLRGNGEGGVTSHRRICDKEKITFYDYSDPKCEIIERVKI